MIYTDDLYGASWELPQIVEHLMRTRELTRLERVSLGVLPVSLNPFPLTNRFLHSMGVCYLAHLVLEQNPSLEPCRDLILAASLLHDAGSPGLSRLAERCLREETGKDAEQFLETVLNREDSPARAVLDCFHVSPKDVAAFVCGEFWPMSRILNGSLDIDNLDNVARFKKAARIKGKNYNPAAIASSFRFRDGQWTLFDSCYEEVEYWLDNREAIYETAYSDPHLALAAMIDHALQIAFFEKEIEPDIFFSLDDDLAIQYLHGCNPRTAYLIAKASSGMSSEWYQRVSSAEYVGDAPKKIKLLASQWSERKKLADLVSHTLGIREEYIGILASKGKDRRTITIPFADEGGKVTRMMPKATPIYRFVVFASPHLGSEVTNQIQKFLIEEIDRE